MAYLLDANVLITAKNDHYRFATFPSVADYWLVAYALEHDHTVVTHEKPAPNAKHRVKIPDFCGALGVPWVGPFEMLERLGASF